MKIQNAFRVGLVGTLGVGIGLLIINSVVSLSTIIIYIGAALFIALGLDPIVTWLEKKSFPRWAALITVMLCVLALFTGVIWMVVPIIVDQVGKLVALVPQIQRQIGDLTLLQFLEQQFPFIPFDELIDSAAGWLTDASNVSNLSSGILSVALSIGSFFFGALIILILTLYFTASLPTMRRGMYLLVPASKRERFADLSEQITDSIGHYVIGQASIAACNGILSFIFLSIIQAPFPPVLAVIAFVASMIPLVGTLSGSIIITLACLIPGLGSPFTALVAGIYYLVYMQIEAYVISPNIMRRAVSVPGAVVVIAALAGGSLLGLLGALVAIPTAAAILLIIKQVVIPRQNEL
ncbi:AI-2E family transporter [Paramicrobacterium chengjingii]|uniref:AI-2E family transporter n=1 Tax=Paramicrobacterium chengjingii TaxID=2769067 RepID=A0ABX6YMB3_9MICO|nr:AI-2E family transporter [Microbacterium chengjingii]QPZ39820.1 AI-2E family transporter [Microbacterium chengjingii]